MKHMKQFGAVLLAGAAILLTSVYAHADSVSLTLQDPYLETASPGTFDFTATVSAPSTNTGVEYLNSDSFSVTEPSLTLPQLTLNDSGFFNNFPIFMNPGSSFTGSLFTVTVPAGTPEGIYAGSFTILGGEDGGAGTAANMLATVDFNVQVTPEPPSWELMALALTGLFAAAGWSSYRRQTSV